VSAPLDGTERGQIGWISVFLLCSYWNVWS